MSLNDTLANVLSKMQNALKSGKTQVEVTPISSVILNVLTILQSKGYVGKFEVVNDHRGNYATISEFQSINKVGVIKPRFDFQVSEAIAFQQRFLPAKGFGIVIVSTSQGLMTMEEAKEKNIGGKLVAYCY